MNTQKKDDGHMIVYIKTISNAPALPLKIELFVESPFSL